MLINEFEWPKRRECYEWTNLNYHWRIPLLIVSNWLAQFAIWSLSCWIWVAKDEFEFWYFTAIAFRTKLIARNVKLIGESLKLTRKSYIIFLTIKYEYSVYQNKGNPFSKVHCFKVNDLTICMWHIHKEQLILFPLVPFLHHICHAWPSIWPLKMTMSVSTFCKFCELDKSVIAKQCNRIAAEIVTSHASWSFLFWKFEQEGACSFSLWSGGSFAHIWNDLLDVWVIIWLYGPSLWVSFALKSVVDMLKMWVHKRTRAENNPTNHDPKQILITCNDHPQRLNAISVCHGY